jgi:hypothetical protein
VPNKWSWIALGAGAYAAFVVATFPAATAYRWLAPPEVRLASVDGTVWSGTAALGSMPGLPLRDIRWNLSALPLLLGRASGTFEARLADGFVRGAATATMSGLVLRNLQTSTQLQTLARMLPINDTTGLVSVDVTELELVDGWPVRLVGMLRLSELEVVPLMPTQSGGLIALGSYEIEFVEGGEAIEGRLADTGGPLEVLGRLALARDRNYELEGLVRARPEADADLVRGLEFMTGEPDASGRRPFNLSGSL